MGATFDSITFDSCSESELKRRFREEMNNLRQKYETRRYTGRLIEKNGTLFVNWRAGPFEDRQQAVSYLIEQDGDKDEAAEAVRIKDGGWVVGGFCRD